MAHGGAPDEASVRARSLQAAKPTRALRGQTSSSRCGGRAVHARSSRRARRRRLAKADALKAYLADIDDDEGDDGEQEQEAAKEAAAQKYLALLGTDNSGANVFGKAKVDDANEGARARKGGKGIALGIEEDKSMEMVIDTRLERLQRPP